MDKYMENMGLRADIEHYEREIEQLKAENEALTKECDRLFLDKQGLLEDLGAAL